MICPTCQQEFDPNTSTAMPFCSSRCRLVDLGRWIREDYAVPCRRPTQDDEELEEADDDPS